MENGGVYGWLIGWIESGWICEFAWVDLGDWWIG